jgi:thymidylate synthase
MNTLDKKYTDLLKDILDNGVTKQDRTGTGTLSVFGRQIRHKMSEGFPLLTTKKMHWKSIVTELIWFLRGDTSIEYLLENDCNIWTGDAYKNFINKNQNINLNLEINKDIVIVEGPIYNATSRLLTQEEFINKIKTNDEFANKWGELGPVYGKQWRSWDTWKSSFDDGYWTEIDQIANAINDLRTNPDSRRIIVSSWNVGEIDQMTLPPCHNFFQFYTRELSLKERKEFAVNKHPLTSPDLMSTDSLNSNNIPTRAISLMWNQRSVDTFLGLPFNIASYGLLLEIIAKEVNMVPDELIGNLGDTHLYLNHIEQAKEQIGREYDHEERHEMLKEAMGSTKYQFAIQEQVPFSGGLSEYYDIYKIPCRTREPYPLPQLKLDDWYSTQGDVNNSTEVIMGCLMSLNHGHIALKNYQSHPSIKAPLSN